MTPMQVVEEWVHRFNAGDAAGVAAPYHDDAVNPQNGAACRSRSRTPA